MHHHRAVVGARKNRFFVAAEVVAPLRGISALLQNFNRFVVGDARKRGVDVRELGRIAPDRFQFPRAVLEHRLHDVADQAFAQRHHVFQVRVGRFRLEHPEFGEVAARLRFLRAEGRPEGVDLAERHGRRFDVELARTASGRLSRRRCIALRTASSCLRRRPA